MSDRALGLVDQLGSVVPEWYAGVCESPLEGEKHEIVREVSDFAALLSAPSERRFVHTPGEYDGDVGAVDAVVHMGCHSPKTPVVIDAILNVVETIGYSPVGLGGFGNCCGIEDLKRGNVEAAERVDGNRFANIEAFSPEVAIAECTSCHAITHTLSLGYREPSFAFPSLVDFLLDHHDALLEAIKRTEPVRVTLHDHFDGRDWTGEEQPRHARELLSSLPGVEVVEMAHTLDDRLPCNLTGDPAVYGYDDLNEQILTEAEDIGADYLVTFWHGCQRSLLYQDHKYPVSVKNVATFIAERLGYTYRDRLREFLAAAARGDIEWILDDAAPAYEANGLTREDAERVVRTYYLPTP